MTQAQFKELFDQHFDSIRNYAWYRSGDPELATDIAQDVFMKIWEKQPDPGSDKIRGLLFKMARDLFVSHYRRQQTARQFQFSISAEMTGEDPEERLNYEETKRQYEAALRAMPEKQRVVFLMSRADRFTYPEIAERLGLSVKAIEKRMKLALESLKKALNHP